MLERYPTLDHVAYLLVGWAGVKLLFISGHSFEKWFDGANPGSHLGFTIPEMPGWLFWTGMGVIAVGGSLLAFRQGPKELSEEERKELENLFTYHAPKGDQTERYAKINEAALNFAIVVKENTPKSADQSAAIRQIREARMTANSAIACNE